MRNSTWGGFVAAGGLLLVGSVLVRTVLDTPASGLHPVVDLVMIGGAGVALLYAGYWHAQRSLIAEQSGRIFGWTAVTTLLFVGIGVVALFVGSRTVEPGELVEVTTLTASVGLATGLFVGTALARLVESVEAAARAEARTEALEAERARAERLNDLLRHYVLNGVNVISGHVGRLRPAVPGSRQSSLDTIDRRAHSTATLVEYINSLLAAEREPAASTTVDLAAAVETAVRTLDREPTVRLSTPDAPTPVRASGTLDDALQLLFDGVATVTGPDGEVTVACDHGATAATVAVTARPVELSDPVADSLFEPMSDVGLEFYLSRRLVDGYGDLRLGDCAADTLQVELVVERE